MREYKVTKNLMDEDIISYEENGFAISFKADLENPDYQAYLRWLENPTE